MVKYVSDLRLLGFILRLVQFPPQLTHRQDITDILLKVSLTTPKKQNPLGQTLLNPNPTGPARFSFNTITILNE